MKRLRTSTPVEAFRYAYQMDSTVTLESSMFQSDGRFTAAGSISGRWSVWGYALFLSDGQLTEFHSCGVGGGMLSLLEATAEI